MAAGPVFLVSSVIQGSARSGFDFSRNAFSQLSLGDLGWIQIATFLMTGALTIAGASGIASALRSTRNGRRIAQLIAVYGASLLAAGVFTADPGEGFPSGAPQDAGTLSTHGLVHLASASVGFLALCAAFVLLGRHFHRYGRVAWALPCYVVPAFTVAGISASATTIVAFTVGAGIAILWLTAVSSRLRSDLTDHLS